MTTVLLDSSAVLGLVDRADPRHDRLRVCLADLQRSSASLFLTNFLRAECHALLGSKIGWDFARTWLEDLDIPVERVSTADESRAIEILLRQVDKSYSLVDATSFAVMERLGIRRALTLDRHFRQFGFEAVPD